MANRPNTPGAGPFKKLRALECFPEVDRMVREGYPARIIAKYIQDEASEYTDVAHTALTSVLHKYRESIPPAELIKTRMPLKFLKAVAQVEDTIRELKELKELYALQRERMKIDMATEQSINKLFSTTYREFDQARKLLETSVQMKMDMGLITRNIGKIDISGDMLSMFEKVEGKYKDKAVGKILTDPTARHRLKEIADQIKRIAENSRNSGKNNDTNSKGKE